MGPLPSINPVDQVVVQSLMIPLMMIVFDEFPNRPSEVPLADRNHPIETFLFDRSDEALRVGVGIRRSRREAFGDGADRRGQVRAEDRPG